MTRKSILISGLLNKKKKNVLEVKGKRYLITDFLAKRIRLKEWLLGLMVFTLTILWGIILHPYSSMPIDSAADLGSDAFVEALAITIIYMLAVVIGFIVISVRLVPKNIEEHIKEELL